DSSARFSTKRDAELVGRGSCVTTWARAAEKKDWTTQSAPPRPRHYLQSSNYSNMTTIRTSPDRFNRHWWDRFLYGSRLASAVGVWPWSDVFMSSGVDNLLLAKLSAGAGWVGDPVGSESTADIMNAG